MPTIIEFKTDREFSANEMMAINLDQVTTIRDSGSGYTKFYFQSDIAGLPFIPVKEEYDEVMRKIAQHTGKPTNMGSSAPLKAVG
ncbi:MAG: hypothetical protein ACK4MV_08220 [Beijerinckiaceae bacterium]